MSGKLNGQTVFREVSYCKNVIKIRSSALQLLLEDTQTDE
jgi:hypothetical protein